jgi:hypothetical protein
MWLQNIFIDSLAEKFSSFDEVASESGITGARGGFTLVDKIYSYNIEPDTIQLDPEGPWHLEVNRFLIPISDKKYSEPGSLVEIDKTIKKVAKNLDGMRRLVKSVATGFLGLFEE